MGQFASKRRKSFSKKVVPSVGHVLFGESFRSYRKLSTWPNRGHSGVVCLDLVVQEIKNAMRSLGDSTKVPQGNPKQFPE